jgi:hypothetical protein
VAAEIGERDWPLETLGTSSPVQVSQFADLQDEVKAKPPTDSAAKQGAIDAELNRPSSER